MKCKVCGEEFEVERFPVCPFCMTKPESESFEVYPNQVQDLISNNEREVTLLSNNSEEEMECPVILTESENSIEESDLNIVDVIQDCSSEVFKKVVDLEFTHKNSEDHIDNQKISKIRIDDVYPLSYKSFYRHCKRKNLIYMEELSDNFFAELESIKGFGVKTISKLKAVYDDYNPDNYTNNNSSSENSDRMYSVGKKIEDLNVDSIKVLGVSLRTINDLKKHDIFTLSELSKVSTSYLETMLKDSSFKEIMNVEYKLKESPEIIFENILSEMETSDNYIALLYRAEGFTLQETGDDIGKTRERVRQIVNRIQSSLSGLARCVMNEIKNNNDFIYVQEILESFDNDDYGRVLLYILTLDEEIVYLDFAEVFLVDSRSEEPECDLLESVSEIIGDGTDLLNVFSDIEAELHHLNLDFLDLSDIKNMLVKHNYKIYGTFALPKRTSYGYLAAQIVKEYFKKGIRLNQNESVKEPDLYRLRELMLEKYEISSLPESDRALSSRISEFLIISGRGYAIAEENVVIDIGVFESIIDKIEEYEGEKIFYTQLFAEFKGILNMTSNVDNYHFLHGILMHFYPDRYEYTRDYLIKEGISQGKSGAIHEILLDYIENIGRPVHKDDIKRAFGFSDIMIYTAMSMENNLIQWEHNYYTSTNLVNSSADEVEWLRGLITDVINSNDGYCSERMLYIHANAENEEYLIKNSINNPKNLFYIVAYYFEREFEFRRPHICKKGRFGQLSTMDIALDILGRPDVLSFNIFAELSKKLNWSPVTSGAVFQEIEKAYIRVSDDEYILRESLIIEDANVGRIESSLLVKMESGVVSLLTFDDWEELPDIGFKWNSFLLSSIIEQFCTNIKVIEPNMRNRRYQKGIVVELESDLSNYPEVIASVLEVNGVDEISEGKMLSYLIVNGLTYKMIPKELYKCDEIKFKKGMFSIK